MPRHVVTLKRWQVMLAFVAVVASFVVQGVLLKHLIDDVNRDRLASCERTYEGVREVFRPFFRPPKVRTAKERHDIAKFNRVIDRLVARCGPQTGVKGAP